MDERDHSDPQPGHDDDWHDGLRAAFPEYAVAVALGQPQPALHQTLRAHLEGCAACRAELDALIALVAPAYTGKVEYIPSARPFDLSFLPAPAKRRHWFVDDLGRLVVEFSEALMMSLRPMAQAARGQALYHYKPEPQPQELAVTIEVFSGDADPDLGNVQVLVDVPGRDPFDQSGIHVCLSLEGRSWKDVTSETGSVTFAAVPLHLLSRLRVEITLPTP